MSGVDSQLHLLFLGPRHHCAEFQHPEQFPSLAHTLLAEQRWPWRIELDGQGDQAEQRREYDQAKHRAGNVGQPLAEPLAESGYFPQLLVQIVSIGEQTGRLDELLLNAANTFDDQADAAVTKFMAVFPPMLIIILAVIIGFIIAATLLPLIGMERG